MRNPFRRRPTGVIRVTDVRRLNLAPSDKLVVTCPEELTADDAQRIVNAFERFAPGTSIAVLDCGRDVAVVQQHHTERPRPRDQRVYVLAPDQDHAQGFAERWAASAPGRSENDVHYIADLAHLCGILPGAIVVELAGAPHGRHYSALCNALSHKGVRFFSDGTRPDEGGASHPLPPYPPPPPTDPGKPTRWGAGA